MSKFEENDKTKVRSSGLPEDRVSLLTDEIHRVTAQVTQNTRNVDRVVDSIDKLGESIHAQGTSIVQLGEQNSTLFKSVAALHDDIKMVNTRTLDNFDTLKRDLRPDLKGIFGVMIAGLVLLGGLGAYVLNTTTEKATIDRKDVHDLQNTVTTFQNESAYGKGYLDATQAAQLRFNERTERDMLTLVKQLDEARRDNASTEKYTPEKRPAD